MAQLVACAHCGRTSSAGMHCHIRGSFPETFSNNSRIAARAVVPNDAVDGMAGTFCAIIHHRHQRIRTGRTVHRGSFRGVDCLWCVPFNQKLRAFFSGDRADAQIREHEDRSGGHKEGEASDGFHFLPFFFIFNLPSGVFAHVYQTPPGRVIRKSFKKDSCVFSTPLGY